MSTFIKKTENFTCGHCKKKVKGNGYTNHCPNCLWSKHVDKSPGDRAEKCLGMMKPVNLELKKGEYILTHECEKCGEKRRCKTSKFDNLEALTKLSGELVKKTFF
jgi:predicted RNA-binding Zn-ribbon protein involved in translation (DUF1610 family)